MPSGGFEPETPVIERPQIYAFDRTTNGISRSITHWKGHSAERFYQLRTFFFFRIEESDIVRFCAVRLVNSLTTFRS